MDNCRVHKTRQPHGVGKVGSHFATLGQGSRYNGNGRGRKGELKKPKSQVNVTSPNKIFVTDKGNLVRVTTKGQAKTDQIERHGCPTSIQQVFEHAIDNVLFSNATGTEHGESSLRVGNINIVRGSSLLGVIKRTLSIRESTIGFKPNYY